MRHAQTLIALLLALPHFANAELTPGDLTDPAGFVIADGVTYDSNTGLEWVDVTITQGNVTNAPSFDDVLAGGGPGIGWLNDGWRIATAGEVCLLFRTYAGAAPTCPDGGFGVFATPEDSIAFISLLGITDQTQIATRGLFDDGSPGSSGLAVINSGGFINIASNQRPTNVAQLDAGIFLVRTGVPQGQQQIEVSPLTIDFGNVEIGTNAEAGILITNVGSSDLTFLGGTFLSPQGDFSSGPFVCIPENPNCSLPVVLGPGQATAWRAFFFPGVPGPATATLGIESDDPNDPIVSIMLIGNGVTAPILCNGLPATIIGTAGTDVLLGTNGDDVMVGLGGDDLILGRGGNDTICGGDGNDALSGGGGNDTLLGESGNDTLKGGRGLDRLEGGAGRDALTGNAEDDILRGNGGRDHLFGGNGSDDLHGGAGNDVLFGEGGQDTLNGAGGIDICDDSTVAAPTINCETIRSGSTGPF